MVRLKQPRNYYWSSNLRISGKFILIFSLFCSKYSGIALTCDFKTSTIRHIIPKETIDYILTYKNSLKVALKKIIIPFALVIIFLFTGCGHTNELANYDLQSKTFHFEDGVAGGSQQVAVGFTTPLGTKKSLFSSGGLSAALDVAEAVSSVASAIVSSKTSKKLRNAVDMNEMAYYVSEGIEKTLARYYDIQSVESISEQPMFIVETILTKCQLGSN